MMPSCVYNVYFVCGSIYTYFTHENVVSDIVQIVVSGSRSDNRNPSSLLLTSIFLFSSVLVIKFNFDILGNFLCINVSILVYQFLSLYMMFAYHIVIIV